MANSRRDPQPGDLFTSGDQMLACVERQGNMVRWMLRYSNGTEVDGFSTMADWYEMVCDATPAGRVDVKKFTVQ